MSSLSTEHSSSAIRGREGQQERTIRARRRLDLLAAGGLALVAVAIGAVAIAARSGDRVAHVAPGSHVTATVKPVFAASSAGVAPGANAAARAAAAVSQARAARAALAHNAPRLLAAGTAGGNAVVLKALPVPVVHDTAPPTVAAAPQTPVASTPTYTAPVQPAPTYTAPVQPAPTYTAPTPAPTYTAPAPTPTPAPTPAPTPSPSTGGGSSGSGSASGGG
jgi:hypothetical protein